jgi:hypothetical protein
VEKLLHVKRNTVVGASYLNIEDRICSYLVKITRKYGHTSATGGSTKQFKFKTKSFTTKAASLVPVRARAQTPPMTVQRARVVDDGFIR